MAYRMLISVYHLHCCMSAKGNCDDNACAESFFHSQKVECIHGEHFNRVPRCVNPYLN
ncbi:hypothetical protein SAMN05216201_102335 [Pseudomonas linyingensis]|uniref:Integrase catalytic domain-containing protein n=1 Tax=Pseudomonas linyingensis TaxID=915471 RepID=A0A1H6U3T9_9PSED|nr:hypothetical protein SAMN05216201_102335 [Pseudomonas linyingensis]